MAQVPIFLNIFNLSKAEVEIGAKLPFPSKLQLLGCWVGGIQEIIPVSVVVEVFKAVPGVIVERVLLLV